MSMSKYLLALSEQKKIIVVEDLSEFIRQLIKIGTNVNQVTLVANTYRTVSVNMKSFCRPGKSEDRVAQKLGYRDAFDAGFYKFSAGDEILEFDGYNKETDENEALIIKGRVVNFVETPLYEKFKELYGC
ncbi:plasmid mobilization relaxosome protein MobC [Ruminococcus flavefaciens]|uniref:plasmid mobilization protein n=1 Tax=Ruminococcus flavefaciens TaxID=1265 RepID=UPI0026EAAEB6|nr:plasmid mobilization relaxosome protein MobC [Ruminococcus flavefaciens]